LLSLITDITQAMAQRSNAEKSMCQSPVVRRDKAGIIKNLNDDRWRAGQDETGHRYVIAGSL
jgi:hypothetical protein